MLADTDIQALDAGLESVARQSEQHHDNLRNLLQRFHLLLDDYNRLKSDYEEEKESREKYKKLARGQVGLKDYTWLEKRLIATRSGAHLSWC